MKKILCAVCCIVFAAVSFHDACAEITTDAGGALRLRYEYWKNPFDMNNAAKDNRGMFRVKTSLWGKLGLGEVQVGETSIGEDVSVFLKLTNEFRAHTYYVKKVGGAVVKKRLNFDIDEGAVDNLYLDVKKFLGFDIDMRLGRQDFLGTYGEGFVIMDGTPLDGSRTFYFNAAKVTWNVDAANSVDFVYVVNHRDDDFLPIINEGKTPAALNFSDEEAWWVYVKSRVNEDLYAEGYYIYKLEKLPSAVSAAPAGDKTQLNTFGSFFKYSLSPEWTLRGQGAYQFGDYGIRDRDGMGGYIFVDKIFPSTRWTPKASIGLLYLSGDDPATDDVEGWDPLFSRWPWVSELYVLANTAETGQPGYWTNLKMIRTEVSLRPTEKSKLSFWYNYLWSDESGRSGSIYSGEKNRGHLPQVRFDYAVNKNINTYLLVEYLIPGDFYTPDNRDEALFFRAEVSIKF